MSHKLNIYEVRPGMVLEKSVYAPGTQKLLLPHGTPLKESIIKKLISLGLKELEIADRYTLFVNPMDQMSSHLKDIYIHLIKKYASEQIEGNLCNEMVEITKRVIRIMSDICLNEDILDFCVQMKLVKNKGLFDQSVLSSVFSGLVAGALKLDDAGMYDTMVGALLHNIGCLEMPFLIGEKDLKGQQALLWKEHPTYGYYFAIQHNIPRNIAEIILFHHEKWDGSGYPRQLKGEEIPLGARIAGTCSTVSHYLIFENMQPYEAMEYLYGTSNIYFDKKIVDAFVGNVALYPLGAMVRLTTGDVGIIVNVRKNHGPRPLVYVYYNRFNKPLSEPRLVDLGQERTVFISEILG